MLQEGFIASSYVSPLSQFLLSICKTEMHTSKKLSLAQNYLRLMDDSLQDNLHLASLRSRSFSALPDLHIVCTPWCLPIQSPAHLTIHLLALNLLLCSVQCAQAQSQMQFSIHWFFFKVFPCSQALLTNSIVGSIPCTTEGVQAGRELPIPPCQAWHQGSAAPSLPTLPLSVILWFLNAHMLAQTCSTSQLLLQQRSLHSYCFLIPHTTYLSITQTRLHPTWTRFGLPLPCPLCSLPRVFPPEGELPSALMAEAVALPPSPTGTAPSPGPRMWPYHPPAPGRHPPPGWLPLPMVRPARTRCPRGTRHLLPAPSHTLRQGEPPARRGPARSPPGKAGEARGRGGPRPSSVPSRSRSPLPAPGAPARLWPGRAQLRPGSQWLCGRFCPGSAPPRARPKLCPRSARPHVLASGRHFAAGHAG